MKFLYISDLDGTLLDNCGIFPDNDKFKINELIKSGLLFTIATARTFATVIPLLDGVNINCPIILMNGVMIYDLGKKIPIDLEIIPDNAVQNVLACLKKHDVTGFIYTWNNKMTAWYEKFAVAPMKTFYNARRERKTFIHIPSFFDIPHTEKAIYFCICNTSQKLLPVYNELKNDLNLNLFFYEDIYNPGYCFLEIASSKASKFHAANKLRSILKPDKLIGFGDNMNDLPLLNACDDFYAVENAHPEIKKVATGIIESNMNHGVANFIEKNYIF